MKIVCATDFSPRANAAVRVAGAVARLTGGSVELLHVADPVGGELVGPLGTTGEFQESIRREAEDGLAAEAAELRRAGVTVTTQLIEGSVEAAILDRARTVDADLIVMGAKGRSAVGRYFLGSGADRTIRRADRPVLIVPPGVESLPADISNARPLRLVVALDGRVAGGGPIELARTLRRHLPCDVTFLRLYWPIEEYVRLGLTGAHDLLKADPEIIANLQRSLAKQVGTLPGIGETSFSIQPIWTEAGPYIVEEARKHDLLIMGAESRSGLARVTHAATATGVADHVSGVPVIFVPASKEAGSASHVPVISTVLVATDLSPEGNRAIPFAYSLLAPRGGTVELCHVHERPIPAPAYVYDELPVRKLSPVERSELENKLRALIPTDASALGIATHVSIVDGGEAATGIQQAAERLAADSIVLSARGHRGAVQALFASVPQKVAHHARRPVFVVSLPHD
jgi:nucleotide-binding universal stress UspA family protein